MAPSETCDENVPYKQYKYVHVQQRSGSPPARLLYIFTVQSDAVYFVRANSKIPNAEYVHPK